MKGDMEEETVAKNNKREVAESTDDTTTSENTDMLDGERPEMPEDMEDAEMGSGPMGGGFPGEMATMSATETNEWLVPMTATGIISGTIILATVAVCLTMFFLNKKRKD